MGLKNFLSSLTRTTIQTCKFPVKEILANSLYYPFSGFYGGVVEDCNTKNKLLNILSFIYCDYFTDEEAHMKNQDGFYGYHVLGSRPIKYSEITPDGWTPEKPPDINYTEYTRYREHREPFIHWTVYERDESKGDKHGPERFSLLFIGGEVIDTYKALYLAHNVSPRALAIIQPGDARGLNWTYFREKERALAWVVNNNPNGIPDFIYYGGHGTGYNNFDRDDYQYKRKIDYSILDYPEGVIVYEKIINKFNLRAHEENINKKIDLSFLRNLRGKKVMLYVSSSNFKKEYLSLPFDYVILNNCEYFRGKGIWISGDKVIMLPFDNNKALRILKDYGIKIQCFIGIQDGCIQGGNYECVNNNSFFGRLSPVLDEKVLYLTNHWDSCLQRVDPIIEDYGFLNVNYGVADSFSSIPLFDESISFSCHESNERNIVRIPIQRKNPQTLEKLIGKIIVKISHASIWDHEDEFDCIIHSDFYKIAKENYCPADNEERVYISLSKINRDPIFLLDEAQKNGWRRIGLVPFMNGHYHDFVEYCRNYNGDFPEVLHFFYLEDRDMAELRGLLE